MDLPEFRYLIEDIFEVKCGWPARECREWASRLIRQNTGARRVESLPGFLIGDALLVVKESEGDSPSRFLLIDSLGTKKIEFKNERAMEGSGVRS